MEIKKLSEDGLLFLLKEEGMRLKPYLDSAGVATISAGVTYYPSGKKVTMQDPPISSIYAMALFKTIVKHYEKAVWSLTRADLTQNMFSACVSICYNIGVAAFKNSTLLKRINRNPHDLGITSSFFAWRFAGGKPILEGRRVRESHLYFT